MKTYWYNGVMYTVNEEEFNGLVDGWLCAKDLFG